MNLARVRKYAKAIIAIVGAVITSILAQFPDATGIQLWGPIIAAVLTAVGVYVVPNLGGDPRKFGRAIVAVLGAILTAFLTAFPDNEMVQQVGPVITAFLTAVGVFFVNDSEEAHVVADARRGTEPGA